MIERGESFNIYGSVDEEVSFEVSWDVDEVVLEGEFIMWVSPDGSGDLAGDSRCTGGILGVWICRNGARE